MLLALLGGCPKAPAPGPPPALVSEPEAPPPSPAGVVWEGRYEDSRWPLGVGVPEGWVARVGAEADPLRVALTDPETRLTVEVRVTTDPSPTPRDPCAWTFLDEARYRAVRLNTPVRVATCTPFDPRDPRLLAYAVTRDGATVHMEVAAPGGRLEAARGALDEVAGTLRFR